MSDGDASMREGVLERIARLASLAVQRRFLSNGTREEYMLPEETLNDVDAALERVKQPDCYRLFRGAELARLQRLREVLDREASAVPLDGSITNQQLVESNVPWSTLRSAAQEVLDEAGFDLVEWERRECEGSRRTRQ